MQPFICLDFVLRRLNYTWKTDFTVLCLSCATFHLTKKVQESNENFRLKIEIVSNNNNPNKIMGTLSFFFDGESLFFNL